MAIPLPTLEEFGTIVKPLEGGLIYLDKADSAWIVTEGKIDIFVCTKSSDDSLGARHHFLRVEEGCAAFGIEFRASETVLVASAVPSTKLLRVPLDSLRRLIVEDNDHACMLVENWIIAVGNRVCTKRFPLSFVDACVESVINIPDTPKAVVATERIAWVHHKRGESIPLGDSQFSTVNGTGYFPVSRFGWLLAAPYAELQAISTSSLAAEDHFWPALRAFHFLVEQLLRVERTKSLAEDHNRIRERSSLDSVLLESSLRRLTEPIQKGRTWQEDEQTCTDPVFLALQVVGRELGIKLTAPQTMLQHLDLPDPVGSIAKASSVRVRKVALKSTWYKQQIGPLLCFMEEDQRPVAVLQRSSSRAELYDPATRGLIPLDEQLASQINPIAYTLYRPFPLKRLNKYDLIKFGLERCKGDLLLIALTGVAVGALAVVNPYITGIVFDQIIPGAERNQLYQMAILLLVVSIASSLFTLVRGFVTLRLQGKMDADVQAAVWDRLLGLPVSFFRDYSAGDLAQRSMGIAQIREIMTGSVVNALLSGIFSVFSFALLFFYSVTLAVIATGLVLFASILSMAGAAVQLGYGRQIQKINGELSSKLLQFVSGIAKFRVSGTEGRAFASWARDFSRQKQDATGARRVSNLMLVFNSVFPTICLIVIFYANAHFMASGQANQLSTGQFLAFIAAFTQFLVAALTLSRTFISVLSIVPIYERTKPILENIPESGLTKSNPGVLSGEIEINHVSFSYREDSPLVLRDLTLRIGAGQAVAFVGTSGCGKSTLLRMLLGFERPGSGAVYYDGQDLSGLDIQAVRRQIGVVLQTSKPVGGSIFENIVGSAPLTIDDAWEACRLAGLDEDIKRMPMGLHTMLSDGGGGISGGQKQRLMIARAIVGKPRILLFDEATSALDNRTQAIVSHSLAGLRATRVVIAHRLSTVINMDKIFVLDKGSVAESGTYAELMERKGLFYELAKRQLA